MNRPSNLLGCMLSASIACAPCLSAETEFNVARATIIWNGVSDADRNVEVEVEASSMRPGARCIYEAKAEHGMYSTEIKLFPGENVVTTRTESETYSVFIPFSVHTPSLRVEMACTDRYYHLTVNEWSGSGEGGVETYYLEKAAAGLYKIRVCHMVEGLEFMGYDANGNAIWKEVEPVAALTTVRIYVDDELVSCTSNADGKETWGVGTLVLHADDQVGGYSTDGGRLDVVSQGSVEGVSPQSAVGSRYEVTAVWGTNGFDPVVLSVGDAALFRAEGVLYQYYYGANQLTAVIDNFISSDEHVGMIDALGVFVAMNPGHTQVSCLKYPGAPIDVYVVQGVEMAVDGDRDGEINFRDPDDKRCLFWVNDDYDYEHMADAPIDLTVTQDDDDPAKHAARDCDDDYIGHSRLLSRGCERDLEDFARLHLKVDNALLSLPGVSFALRLENLDGSPKINLFEAVQADEKYLTDVNTAEDQITKRRLNKTAIAGAEVPLANNLIKPNGEVTPFLLEACEKGVGKLTLVAKVNNRVVSRSSVRLELHKIAFFYDVFRVAATGEKWSSIVDMFSDQPVVSGYQAKTDEKLLLVHGWNMPEWEKRSWTETTFKRLWWQGYQGSVALFDWPTLYDFGGFWDVTTNLRHFDNSEFRAWLSSDALAAKFGSLNSHGQLRVLAHSMGNVVAASALRKYTGKPLHTYVATQAALSAQYFDNTMASRYPAFNLTRPDTPDVFGCFPPSGEAYLKYIFNRVKYTANYYNKKDWALKHWEANNRLKPDDVYGYGYVGNLDNYQENADLFIRDQISLALGDERERFEIFAYCAESRSLALGQLGGVSNFGVNWDLQSSPLRYNDKHYSHSRQFRSFLSKERFYWRKLSGDCGFYLSNDTVENQ